MLDPADMKSWLRARDQQLRVRDGLRRGGFYVLLLKHGRAFTPRPCPEPFRRQPQPHQDNPSFALAVAEGLVYVVGVAWPAGLPGTPCLHAWCVERSSDLVIDCTWKEAGIGYYGVPLSFAQRTPQEAKSSVFPSPYRRRTYYLAQD
jgi:hypothetical protein